MIDSGTATGTSRSLWEKISRRFNLHSDKADDHTIDKNIRSGVRLSGSNLWALICAIFLASIGLNVNSASAIIGAMLISPLMGPIVGVGYGAGIYDFALIKRSLKNLAMATGVSLLASTTYFLISPLGQAQSELLARTSPTIWDVLIAFIGGLVGVVGATRKDKGNVIPGVAIATALMPPLCTAGFGLAHGNWQFMLGAFYLYSINSVFIAFATILMVWILRPQHVNEVDDRTQLYVRRGMLSIVAITAIPSIYLAYQLVSQEIYQQQARHFIEKELVFEQALVAESRIESEQKRITAKLVGNWVNDEVIHALQAKLAAYKLEGTQLQISQAGNKPLDLKALRASLLSESNNDKLQHAEKDALIHNLQQQLQQQEQQQQTQDALYQAIRNEVMAQYPDLSDFRIGPLHEALATPQTTDQAPQKSDILVILTSVNALNKPEQQRLQRWLSTRLSGAGVHLLLNSKKHSDYLPAVRDDVATNTEKSIKQ